MSSPSGSSISSYRSQSNYSQHQDSRGASASTSGRTTPEPHHFHHQHQHHAGQGGATAPNIQNSKVLPHTIYGTSPSGRGGQPQAPRRSSTPSQAFLRPLFFSGFNQQPQPQQQQQQQSTPNNADNSAGAPRRTSFGSALGNRLGALSSLGGASGWGSPVSSPNTAAASLDNNKQSGASTTSSTVTSPALRPVDSFEGSSAAGSEMSTPLSKPKPEPRKAVERRHICVPDGCGGYVTVEQKG